MTKAARSATAGANFGLVLRRHAAGDRLAAIDLRDPARPREVTYAALDAECDAVARGLVRRGLGIGDRVGVLALNRVEYLAALFGAMRAGCVPVPINVKLPRETVRYILRDAGCRLVFSEATWRPLVPEDIAFVDFDGDYGELIDPGPFGTIAPAPNQVSMQPYTSGTTGRPKGVLLSHAGQNWAAHAIVRYRRIRPDDRKLVSAPFFHKNALVAIKTALVTGACLVIMPRFDAGGSIRAVNDHRCTMLTGVPTMMHLILAERDALAASDTSSVRIVSMGSAPASATLIDALHRAFPQAEVHLNYGTTEGGPIMLGWYHPQGRPKPIDSVGYPMPGCEYRLKGGRDENEGELVVRNPGVALGYHNLPEETARRFTGGWYRTGDVMRRDADGWFYFLGRTDDMFVCAGENIYPGEVEALLERHPEIVQATVLPFADEIKGHLPYAFVVRRPGSTLDEEAVRRFALDNGPAYAHPRRVFFLSEIPLTGTNKIDRAALRAHAEAQLGAEENPSCPKTK